MAIANLHETIQFGILEKARLEADLLKFQTQKTLAVNSQADLQSLLSSEKHSVRDYFKNLFNEDDELQELYTDYTQIPDFEEAIDKITAEFQDQLDELTAWETILDTEITTASAELEELKAYQDSWKTMLSSNIQDDFNYGQSGS